VIGCPLITVLLTITIHSILDFMAVQIPPWLNLDPIAPARIRLAANAQRNQAAASERAAQAQADELQFRRENAANLAAQDSEKQAAQERAALRRDQVLKQTNDRELAQAAGQMQLRREYQAQRADQFQQTLRMKQQAAEAEAKTAAQQMQGAKAVQEGLQRGESLQKLITENAPMLFAKHPERMTFAVPKGVTGPQDFVAHELMDEQGNPTGVKVRRGAGGSIVPLPRTEMSPEGRMRQDQILAGIYSKQLDTATGEEEAALQKKLTALRDRIEKDIERRGTQQIPGPLPPRAPAVVPNPAAQSIPPGGSSSVAPDEGGASVEPDEEAAANMVRVTSPDGKTGMIPEDQLDAALEAGYEEIDSEGEAQV
jgi:hypothetical protein